MPAPITFEAWTSALQALLPPGRAFTREVGSTLAKLLESVAAMFKAGHDTLDALALEADPRQATDNGMLPEWERLLGLPDACTEPVLKQLVPGVYADGTYELVSFARATDATVVDENGLVQTVGPDVALYEHDVDSLIGEAPSTNLCLWSNDFNNAVWGRPSATVVSNNAIGLDGELSADTLSVAASSSGGVFELFTVVPGQQMVFSFYAKRSAVADACHRLYDQSNAVTIASASYYAQINADVFTRIQVPFLVPAGCVLLRAYVLADIVTAGPKGAVVDGAQLEVAAFATSYIPTMASAVSRLAKYAKAGLLINRAATNICKQSQSLTTAPWVAGTVAVTLASATGLGLPFFRLAKTVAALNEAFHQVLQAVAANEVWSGSCLLMASSSTEISLGLWSDAAEGWGVDADSSAKIVSGPGAVLQLLGGLHAVTGLSHTEPTLLSFTRTFRQAGNMRLTIYPDRSTSSTIGKSNLVTRAMVVAGADSGGSYIPTTTVNVARAADVAVVNVPQTIFERRAQAFARLTEQGGQSRQYFMDLAAALGEPGCTVTEFRPMNCNSDCNDALYSEADIFSWRMNIPHANVGARPMNCNDDCNDALDLGGESPIECPIRERAPAHTSVYFAYQA